MISWGLASMATCLATGPWGLYIARVVLGIAEAGFLPGVLLYLTFFGFQHLSEAGQMRYL